MTPPERDPWTILPAAGLLGFAGWVALLVETKDVAAAIVFVTGFLAVVWRACRWYQQVRQHVNELMATREQPDHLDDPKWMSG